MGKGGRVACILTPWLLTIASFVCITMIEISGWNKGILGDYYFMKVNFTDLDVSSASTLANTTTLTTALKEVEGNLANIYEIHLWNYWCVYIPSLRAMILVSDMDGLCANLDTVTAVRQTIPSCSAQDALLASPSTSSIRGV
jgi:hypothetical protein